MAINDYIHRARDFLFARRTSYRSCFLNPVGAEVLRDLAKFCRANESTFLPDERATALLEGRREVWLRIQHHLNLSDDDLWSLYGSSTPLKDKVKP